ncbi:MAG: LPS export ABC transporter periplasmic protein LptC [Spirochaetales bacterium]|nr:LPS export ABC transporter periplasmic protein LptC [Spirochaetales bacterium]
MRKNVIIIFSCIFAASCSLNYEASVSESLDESIPTSELVGVKRVQIQGGKPKVTFEAEKAVVWEKREETELYSFVFNEFDGSNEIITRGEADYLIIKDNQDAQIEGEIYGYSVRNEASIEADNLNWTDETRKLASDVDSTVTIQMDNGSVLKGKGFEADLYTSTTSFTSGIGGTLESGSEGRE